MSPDKICEEYHNKGSKISIIVENDLVYIEGKKADLEFLGKLILAQANFSEDNSFHISPTGAGNDLFNSDSTHGICIHRKEK